MIKRKRKRKPKPQKIIFLVAVSFAVILSISYPFIRSYMTPYKAVECFVTSVGLPQGEINDRWKMAIQTDGCGPFYTTIDSPYVDDGSFNFSSWHIQQGKSYDFEVEGFQWEPIPEIVKVSKLH